MKGFQATGQAPSPPPPPKKKLQHFKHEISTFFPSLLWVIFALVDPDTSRIRIRNTDHNKQHLKSLSTEFKM